MHETFAFGANAVRMVADPGYGDWPWAAATSELCQTTSQLFAAVLPPSEGAMENNPADNNPDHPASKPGMVQAAQRMSNLSHTCPQVRGIIIDESVVRCTAPVYTMDSIRCVRCRGLLTGFNIADFCRVYLRTCARV